MTKFIIYISVLHFQSFSSVCPHQLFRVLILQAAQGGRRGSVVMPSGWETEGPGFKPWWLQATFDPGFPRKSSKSYSQPDSVTLMIDFERPTLMKDFIFVLEKLKAPFLIS